MLRCQQLLSGQIGPAFVVSKSNQGLVQRGDQGVLRLASERIFTNATFLGTQYVDGQAQHLFFDAKEDVVVHVAAADLSGAFDPNAILLTPTNQRCDLNCASHAATSVVFAARPDIGSLVSGRNGSAFDGNREQLRKTAEAMVYDLDLANQTSQVRKFFDSQGMQMNLLPLNSETALKVLHNILSQHIPVYLAYSSTQEFNWSRPKEIDANGGEKKTSNHIIGFSRDDRSRSGHAIALLGLIRAEPETELVLVLDSAFGELQLWPWWRFRDSVRSQALAVYPSAEVKKASGGLPADLVQTMRLEFGADSNKPMIDWLEKNPARISPFSSADAFVSGAKEMDWIVVRRDPRSGDAVIGQVVDKGTYSNTGKPYVQIRRYSFGRFSDDLVTLDQRSVVDAFRITPPNSHNLNHVKSGDWVDLIWNSSPEKSMTTVSGPVLSVNDQVLKIYDTKSSTIIRVGQGDLISQFSHQSLQPDQAEVAMRPAQVSELINQYLKETYNYRLVGVYDEIQELKNQLDNLQSIFPLQNQAAFDTEKIKVGQRVAIKLADGRHITVERGRFKRNAFIGEVVSISPTEVVIQFGYEGRFKFTPDTTASILRYETIPARAD